ncbi:AAA family ATPase [Bacillus sp. FJAT-49736]|uniref:ATP-binding protein n=1 Tax=Bacillus sp. FJAT-49736 TaxID=2833582 RepID=UPI001BCA3832|nr:AAA family ATPase [Bacillus sp. FJAT-49736]
MRIKELFIYGYGKLSDMHIPSFSALQVVFGENEAGKSTLMSFIHSILFGFPTKQQSELRYEPKNSGKYGGKLVLETKEYGEVTIERIRGKASGDVTVTLRDGTIGNEELLAKILNGMDRRMFQAIFSFNIHGIQDVGRMKGEEISKYLLAAGTVGTDTFLHAEEQLQKVLDALFKPNGRKPELNQLLDQLKEKESELKTGKRQNESYTHKKQQALNLQVEMEQLQEHIHTYQQNIQNLNQLLQDWPLFQERQKIHHRLLELGETAFPIDGISRLEHLEDQLRSANSNLTTVQERRKLLETQLEAAMPDSRIIENESYIQLILEQWPQAQDWQEQIQALLFDIERIEEQIKRLGKDIHFVESELHLVSTIDLGIAMKERVKKATTEYFSLTTRHKELMKQAELEEKGLQEIEWKVERIEERLIPEDEFRRLSENQKKHTRIQQIQMEYQHVKEQVQMLRMTKGSQQSITSGFRLLAFLGLLGCLMVYSFLSKQGFLSVISAVGIVVLLVSNWLERGKRKESTKELSSLLEREQDLAGKLKELDTNPDQSDKYTEQLDLRQEWKELLLQLEIQQSRFKNVQDTLDNWKLEWRENAEHLTNIKNELRLGNHFSAEQLQDAYEILNELFHSIQKKEQKMVKLNALKGKYSEWADNVDKIANVESNHSLPIQEAIIHMKNEWRKATEKRDQYKELSIKLEELNREEQKWTNSKTSLMNAMDDLLKNADAKDPEEFRKKGLEDKEFQGLQIKLEMIDQKLNVHSIEKLERIQSLDELESEREKWTELVQSNSKRLEIVHKELAQVNYEISVLEEGGTFTEKLHAFYQEKDIFNQKARKWAKAAVAKHMLKLTMDRLKNDRFPKVIEKAEEFVRVLTNSEYTHLHLQEDGKFVAERKDRTIFVPEELSQATREQLYVALRFALVHVLKEEYPYPLIIDDSFVNFDRKRTKMVLELLKEISNTNQVLFFSCHEHLLEEFSEGNILHLTEIQSKVEKLKGIG